MPELLRESTGLPWIGRWRGNDCRVALEQNLRLGVIIAMLGALLTGCTADKHPSQEESNLANAAKDVAIPLEAGKKNNPLPETGEVVSQGQEVFLGSCAQCHAPDGRGDTSLGHSMAPPAMDLTSAHVQHWSDAELFWIIQNGVRLTGMPAWRSSISENDTWKLARFIHSLPRLDSASASTAVPSQAQAAIPAQDKYALKVLNGVAFSEFKGYESWPVIAISHNGNTLAAILGNPAMINAYKAGIPGNGKPFPDGAKMVKVHWIAKVNVEEPGAPTVPGTQHDVDLMLKDSKRFADSGGWGYGAFEYDAASNAFRAANLKDKPPQGNDAKCGFACHTAVKSKDYVFTGYGQR
ncbi:cytochrome P460 family protein [Acidicapsa acidisoli]|uniref:cytochrome P460 family protein n=1 Tax=Acidicapsa acidisoli TaxID=1615681 RepID=UPI0021E0B0DB|nr:cytochrome P460 family protein [Acidicapsa acidisoli]